MKLSEIKIIPIMESLRLEDISDKEYFGDNYANYISNSRLALLQMSPTNPTKFFEGLQANSKYADSLLFGSAVHELTLQPENFFLCETVNRPTAKAGVMADKLYKKNGKMPSFEEMKQASLEVDYYANSWNSDKANALRGKCEGYWKARSKFESELDDSREPIYLDEKNRIRLKSCLEALESNKNIQSLLHSDAEHKGNEKTILLDVKVEAPGNEPFILRLKSKLDNYSIDPLTNTIVVNDVKTTGKLVSQFDDAIENFHYYREMAMYCFLLKLVANKFYGMEHPNIKSNFLVVETIPQYYTKVVPMTKGLFKKGMDEFSHLLKLVAFYCCDGNGHEGFREKFGA